MEKIAVAAAAKQTFAHGRSALCSVGQRRAGRLDRRFSTILGCAVIRSVIDQTGGNVSGDTSDFRYATMQTLANCPHAVVVRMCGILAGGADGRLEARALLEVIGRTSVLQAARLSFRIGSKVGSQRLDAGWIVESFSAADAIEIAHTIAAAVASVSYGIAPQFWDVHKTELRLDPSSTYASRLFATGTAAASPARPANR